MDDNDDDVDNVNVNALSDLKIVCIIRYALSYDIYSRHQIKVLNTLKKK